MALGYHCPECHDRAARTAQARVSDLEKQLAEQTKRAETAEQLHTQRGKDVDVIANIAQEYLERAETAEKRVAELQTLVDVFDNVESFEFEGGIVVYLASADGWNVERLSQSREMQRTGVHVLATVIAEGLPREEALALATKENK